MKKTDFIIKISELKRKIELIQLTCESIGYRIMGQYFPDIISKDEAINKVIDYELKIIFAEINVENKKELEEELKKEIKILAGTQEILKIMEIYNIKYNE